MSMEVDDRDDEQRVLDQLREILEGVEKKQNFRMMVDIGIKTLGFLLLAVVAGLLLFWFCELGGPR